LLAHGRWFSLGTPASSTTKTGRYDIAEILLKVALNTKDQINSNQSYRYTHIDPRQSLAFCVVFSISFFVFAHVSFDHCIFSPLIYGFWLDLLHHQTLFLNENICQYVDYEYENYAHSKPNCIIIASHKKIMS